MDIKINSPLACVVVLACINMSCSSSGSLHKGFTRNRASLQYLYDSKINANKDGHAVSVSKPVVTDGKFTQPGMVRKTRALVIPAIVYTGWKADYEYSLGRSAMAEEVESFVQSAFIYESNRSGSYRADSAQNTDAFTLKIEIDSIGATGSYRVEGHFLFLLFIYSNYQGDQAGPGTAWSRFHYTLLQGDKVVLENYVSNHQTSQPLRETHPSTRELRSFYNTNLSEALSLTFKANIEAIVKAIDTYLYAEGGGIGKM